MTVDALHFATESDTEQAIIDAFDDSTTSTIVHVIDAASQRRPAFLVREAYWDLVTKGHLVPTAAGDVHLKR